MAHSPERTFEFWKQGKVRGSQIWRIRWLSNNFCFMFSQKFSHNQDGMWRRIIVVWWRRASTQNMNHNVLSRSIRDVESLCYVLNANTTSGPSLNALYNSNTCVLDRVHSPKHFCNISNDSVAVIPLETQNFKQARRIFFFIVKITRQTFRVVNPWLPNTH